MNESQPLTNNTSANTVANINNAIFVRIAIYDSLKSLPRVVDLKFSKIDDFINNTTEQIYSLSHGQGGTIPYTIIKEIVENLIHANFKEVTISILNNGNQIMISDQGPGIQNKEKAVLPGFTSATQEMKRFIRGVGSGLPIAKETILFSGGSIDIDDNINRGTVVTLKIGQPQSKEPPIKEYAEKKEVSSDTKETYENKAPDILNQDNSLAFDAYSKINLTLRHIKILYLVLELEEVGPSMISKELNFSLSTSYRELLSLEKEGLLISDSSGKRQLSKKGAKYLEYYSNNF